MASLKSSNLFAGAAGVALAATIGAGAYWTGARAADRDVSQAVAAAPIAAPPSFADLIQRVAPAVVSIDVTRKPSAENVQFAAPQGSGEGSGGQGSPFQFFFGSPGGQGDGQNGGAQNGFPGVPGFPGMTPGAPDGRALPLERATGSGFFISPDGYIVTNNHVVEGATSITVRLADKRQFKARLVGRDPATDLAVVKVDGGGFSYVNFEDKGRPRVGDWVVAVGNPYDLGGTATAGIVSALGRGADVSGSSFVDYMQIDAPINRGNSGGPTFDVYGRVVGVNAAIYTPSGGSVGIGFAIPADVAQSVTRQLIDRGRVLRGYIGAEIQNLTPDIASSLGLAPGKGALVAGLTPGGPAALAGVRPGDVITAVDGHAVGSSSELTQQVALAHAGEDIRLQVVRDGRPLSVTVRSGLRPSEAQLNGEEDAPAGGAPEAAPASTQVLGMSLAPLDAQARQRFGLAGQGAGVVVQGVGQDSDAEAKGLQPGDVILRAGASAVTRPADVAAAVTAARRQGRSDVLLLVSRAGRNVFVPVAVAKGDG